MTDKERDALIVAKLREGLSLSDLQKLLAEEHGMRMTYLDLRMIVAGLPVDWSKHEPAPAPASPAAAQAPAPKPADAGGRTRITISKLVRPGAALSGDVTFASGATAEWALDPMGRIGLYPKPGSSQPTQKDMREFQTELQNQLSNM